MRFEWRAKVNIWLRTEKSVTLAARWGWNNWRCRPDQMQLQEKNWDAIRAKRLLIENCRKIVYCTTALWISWYLFDFLLVCCCLLLLAVFLFLLLLFRCFSVVSFYSFFTLPFGHQSGYKLHDEHVMCFPEYTTHHGIVLHEWSTQMCAFFFGLVSLVFVYVPRHMPLGERERNKCNTPRCMCVRKRGKESVWFGWCVRECLCVKLNKSIDHKESKCTYVVFRLVYINIKIVCALCT